MFGFDTALTIASSDNANRNHVSDRAQNLTVLVPRSKERNQQEAHLSLDLSVLVLTGDAISSLAEPASYTQSMPEITLSS